MGSYPVLPRSFYARETSLVARELLGCVLVHRTEDGDLSGVIVETEAYGPDDPANHAFRGPTERNSVMFGPPGRAYVYRIYGAHWCVNAVTGQSGVGEAVLIRALQPLAGIDKMRRNRGIQDERRLCKGPGNLCAALGIIGAINGADLTDSELVVNAGTAPPAFIVETTRVGISKAAERPWRYYVAGSPYVSRK